MYLIRKTDSIHHHHHHTEGVVYGSFCLNSSTFAVSGIASRRWCIESLFPLIVPEGRDFASMPGALLHWAAWPPGRLTARLPGCLAARHPAGCGTGRQAGWPVAHRVAWLVGRLSFSREGEHSCPCRCTHEGDREGGQGVGQEDTGLERERGRRLIGRGRPGMSPTQLAARVSLSLAPC